MTEERLLAYGTHQAQISKPDEAGVPARAHMERRLANMLRRFGAHSAEYLEAKRALVGPAIGPGERRVWDLYLSIQRWRSGGGMSSAPITLHDIEAVERRFGFSLSPFECDCVKALDLAFLSTRTA